MKATGAEITEFWREWPPGDDWYVEEAVLEVFAEDDRPLLEPTKKYDVADLGFLYWQGQGPIPRGAEEGIPTAREFTKWRKARMSKTFAVDVPVASVTEFRALCKQHGWRLR